MKQDEQKYVIFQPEETVLDSIFKDIVTAVVIAFSVYISQGSTFWTFISGWMAIIFLIARVRIIMNRQLKFRTKEELRAWVEKL